MSDGKTINQEKIGSKYKDKDYTRVTDVLRQIDKGDRLLRWAIAKGSWSAYIEALRKSAERGSKVDNFVKETFLSGKEAELPEELKPYVAAFRRWRAEWNFKPELYDREIYDDELKYVGTLDIYGQLSQDKTGVTTNVVIDIKTGEPTRDKEGKAVYEVYENMNWQTAAYRHALEKLGLPCEGNWILRLFSDGGYVFQPDNNYERSWKIFEHACAIARLRKGQLV